MYGSFIPSAYSPPFPPPGEAEELRALAGRGERAREASEARREAQAEQLERERAVLARLAAENLLFVKRLQQVGEDLEREGGTVPKASLATTLLTLILHLRKHTPCRRRAQPTKGRRQRRKSGEGLVIELLLHLISSRPPPSCSFPQFQPLPPGRPTAPFLFRVSRQPPCL